MPKHTKDVSVDEEDVEEVLLEEKKDDEEEEDEPSPAEIALKFVTDLPSDVRRRVFALQGIQKDFAEVHAKYLEEMRELERRFETLYQPLFDRRHVIVEGSSEPTEEEISSGAKITEVKEEGESQQPAPEGEDAVKGIPNFWLGALQNHEETGELITERDMECLKFLNDISAKNFDDPNKGFSLTFHFAENPFFTNQTLTKSYFMDDEDQSEITLEKAEGCKIDWKPEKNLTVILKKKKQKQKGGKGAVRTVTKEEPCLSFFNFFSPPQLPDEKDDEEDDDEDMDELEDKIEQDYEVGRTIKDHIIPNAVDWFTGEAFRQLRLPPGLLGGDDDDEGDEEEEDDGGHHEKLKKIVPPKEPPECKQQ